MSEPCIGGDCPHGYYLGTGCPDCERKSELAPASGSANGGQLIQEARERLTDAVERIGLALFAAGEARNEWDNGYKLNESGWIDNTATDTKAAIKALEQVLTLTAHILEREDSPNEKS